MSLRAAEQDRPDVAGKRRMWRAWQRYMDPARFVILDETGVHTKMARLHGWAPVGERCRDSVPFGHVWTPPPVQEESQDRRCARGQRLRAAVPHGHVWTPPPVQEASRDRCRA